VKIGQTDVLSLFEEAFEVRCGGAAMEALCTVEKGDETVGLEESLDRRLSRGAGLGARGGLGRGLSARLGDEGLDEVHEEGLLVWRDYHRIIVPHNAQQNKPCPSTTGRRSDPLSLTTSF
jgi:hypothetical protein